MASGSRIVVVTGASAGIGRATAIEFGRQGWRAALLARGIDGLEGARRDIESADICGACAETCRQCAASCERMGDDANMKRCAEACRRCADTCASMAA